MALCIDLLTLTYISAKTLSHDHVAMFAAGFILCIVFHRQLCFLNLKDKCFVQRLISWYSNCMVHVPEAGSAALNVYVNLFWHNSVVGL